MKTFKALCALTLTLFLILAAVLDITIAKRSAADEGIYRVEAKRLADDMTETGSCDLSQYPHITGIYTADGDELFTSDSHYLIAKINGTLYRIEYDTNDTRSTLHAVNCVLGAIFLMICGIFIYIWRKILTPFSRLNSVPQELAKGNLAVPIPEEKSRFFGRFTWGVNLLRETIENDRKREMTLQRDKKLLLLSLSHDIKTPLSAIKLNAKALAKGLYTDDEKRRTAAESINSRADEIEHFVSEITRAASEDFMNFEVSMSEEFLSRIIKKITDRYASQLALSGTEFTVGQYSDCILSCDPDRLAECLQNLIENAVKYGDGKRISIDFDRMDGCELITVSNTGCTIEAKELPQIFESFHRGSNSSKVQGNGLGLFICKRLMSLMNGEVYADIRDGCFCVTLVVRLA